jgi:hypothetical protein
MALSLNLTPDENAQLQEAIRHHVASSQSPSFSVDGQLNKWQGLVNKIRNGYPLGVYDYTNELSSRNVLEDFAQHLSGSLEIKVRNVMKAIDEAFLDETEESSIILAGTAESSAKLPWWWHRMPKKLEGELKEDIESLT